MRTPTQQSNIAHMIVTHYPGHEHGRKCVKILGLFSLYTRSLLTSLSRITRGMSTGARASSQREKSF